MPAGAKTETPVSLGQRYEQQARLQRKLILELQTTQRRLDSIVRSFHRLLASEHFITLLRAEGLDRIPAALLNAVMSDPDRNEVEVRATDAKSLLESKPVSPKAWSFIARMNPTRQIEAARLMIASGCYNAPYARALISVTDASLIKDRGRPRLLMESPSRKNANQEITDLADKLKSVSGVTGTDLLIVLIARGYIQRLLGNLPITKYLRRHWADVHDDLEAALDDYKAE